MQPEPAPPAAGVYGMHAYGQANMPGGFHPPSQPYGAGAGAGGAGFFPPGGNGGLFAPVPRAPMPGMGGAQPYPQMYGQPPPMGNAGLFYPQPMHR
jgi:hypothetical protein